MSCIFLGRRGRGPLTVRPRGRFWLTFAYSHFLLALITSSPCDVYAVVLGVACLSYFAHGICSPPAYGGVQTQTKGNLNVLGFCVGVGLLLRIIPSESLSARAGCLMCFVLLDGVMGMGHAWDREATMETVTNCRLFFVCAQSLCMCLVYCLWYDTLRIP